MKMKAMTWKAIKALLVANWPTVAAAGAALLLVVLASFQGCALRETKVELQAEQKETKRLAEEIKTSGKTVTSLRDQLRLAEDRTHKLTEQIDRERKRSKEPLLNAAGELLLLPNGQPAYRYTDESGERTRREELDVYQLRLQREAERAEQAEYQAEVRRQAFVESQAKLRQLEQTQRRGRPWSVGLGPMLGGQDAGTWWATFGWKTTGSGWVDVGARVAYPVAPAGGLLGGQNPDAQGPATLPLTERPLLPTVDVHF